ncbi:MAG: hypothetical protein Fur0041_22570 [Bacteroidia bacterium]
MKKTTDRFIQFIKRWYRHLMALPALALLAVFIKLFSYSSDQISDEDYRNYFISNYKVFGITIPKDINFCGERVPITDFTVREALEKELLVNTYWQSQTMMYHKRANRWFPVIEPILKKFGVPDDFKYVAIVESGLTNAVSPQQACGFWQLIEPTAKNFGLEINDEVDERYHVEKSTEAACQYFLEAYKRYQNWTLAAASYNLGMGGIDKQLSKQNSGNYYDLYLNEETARYVFRILAIKEIISRPKSYGYMLRPRDLYPVIPTYSVKIDSSITDLAAFAEKQGSTYKILKYLNPWLIKPYLNNPEHKKYSILFPKKGVKIYGLEDDAQPGVNDHAQKDTSRFINRAEIIADSMARPKTHIIKKGETWETIANLYHLDVNLLLEYNKISSSSAPREGDEIVIPVKKNE